MVRSSLYPATDVQLNVRGMRNLHESFRDFVAVETLEGQNKYQTEGLGLQDAKKGTLFWSFPPVLHLQLRRFEYDFQSGNMIKVYIAYFICRASGELSCRSTTATSFH